MPASPVRSVFAAILWMAPALAAAPVQTLAPPAGAAQNLPVQKIGPHDLVAVTIYGAPELSRTARVNADGMVRVPMLKNPVRAQGLLPEQLEAAIAEAYRADQLLVDPVVTVNIVEYASRPISVAGAVKKPVTFQAVGATTLLDALTHAEGLSPDAGSEILVTRRQAGPAGEPVSVVQRIPVRGLIDAADPALNIKLSGGEEIRVPEAGRVFVVGNVRKPGAYLIEDSTETSVLRVLALSEGLAPYAAKKAYIYRRQDQTGLKTEIPFELRRILDRKASDIPLQANDIVYIPDNRTQRVGMNALERALSFGAATASGALIFR